MFRGNYRTVIAELNHYILSHVDHTLSIQVIRKLIHYVINLSNGVIDIYSRVFPNANSQGNILRAPLTATTRGDGPIITYSPFRAAYLYRVEL